MAVNPVPEAVDPIVRFVDALRELTFEVVQVVLYGAGDIEVRQDLGNPFGLFGAERDVLLEPAGGLEGVDGHSYPIR